MSQKDWPGSILSKTPVTPAGPYLNSAASGIWSMNDVAYWVKQAFWPTQGNQPADPYFNYVSMLLPGNGTNGAQNNTFLASNGAAQGPFANPAGYWSNYFDGSSNLTVATNSALSFGTGDFTVEFWINPSNYANYRQHVSTRNAESVTQWSIDSKADGTFYFYTNTFVITSSAQQANTWIHIAAVRSSGVLTLYVNGVSQGTASLTNNFTADAGLGIGSGADSGQKMLGYLSNVRLVKGVAVYTSNFTPSTTPLTAISGTSLLTCQSNVICDTSSNLFAITTNGNAATNTKSPFTISSSYNPYSFSGYFNGSDAYLTVADNPALTLDADFTIEFWFNQSVSGTQGFLQHRNGTTFSTGDFQIQDYGTTVLFQAPGASFLTTGTYTKNVWNHYALVRSGTTITAYLNGIAQGTITNSTSYTGNGGVLRIGELYDGTHYYFNGYMSNVRIVKGTAVYTTNFTPSNAPLTAISGTSLLTCQSSTFVDNSPNALTITVNGGAAVATASNSQLAITRNGNTTQGTFSPYGLLWSNYFSNSGFYKSTALLGSTVSTFTVEFWIFMTAVPVDDLTAGSVMTLDGDPSGATNYFNTGISTSQKAVMYWYDGAQKSAVGSTTIPLNTWTHVAFVVNSNAISMYVNGVAETLTGTTTLTNRSGTSGYMSIGKDGHGYTTGYISNLRVTTTAVYASGFTPSTTPLTAISGTVLLTCQSNRFIDNSSNNFTLTVNGSPSVQRFSPFNPTTSYDVATIGGSGYFDGSGDWLTSATSGGNCVLSGNFTVEAWVYPTSWGSYQRVVSGGASSFYWSLGFSTTWGGGLKINWYDGTDYYSSAYSPGSPINTWYHLAVVRTGSTIYYYINGTQFGTSSYSSTPGNANGGYMIGNRVGATEPWFGYISDARVVLGTNVYGTGSTITIPTAPETAVSGTSILLNFTNAGIPDAAMMNDLETVGNAQVSTSVKKYGTGSLYFDGSGDYLLLPRTPQMTFGSGDFTIEAWVYTASSSYGAIFSTRNVVGGYDGLSLQVKAAASSAVQLLLTTNGSTWQILTQGGAVSANTWTHIAWVRSGTSFVLYINGVSTITNTVSGSVYQNTTNVAVGTDPDGAMNGYIDDLRITKGYARYTANFTPPDAAFPTF